MPTNIGDTLYVTNRRDWRTWLEENFDKKTEVWLIYYRKDSGKPRISYNDAVEEALCFGWVDSIIKKLNEKSFAQRFSVRKKTSNLSQANKERITKLIALKKMTPAGLAAVAHVFQPEIENQDEFEIAPDILAPLKANKDAWKNFKILPDTYRRVRIAYIESQRRHGRQMFEKSLHHFIDMTAKNKRFGFIRE